MFVSITSPVRKITFKYVPGVTLLSNFQAHCFFLFFIQTKGRFHFTLNDHESYSSFEEKISERKSMEESYKIDLSFPFVWDAVFGRDDYRYQRLIQRMKRISSMVSNIVLNSIHVWERGNMICLLRPPYSYHNISLWETASSFQMRTIEVFCTANNQNANQMEKL